MKWFFVTWKQTLGGLEDNELKNERTIDKTAQNRSIFKSHEETYQRWIEYRC